MCGAMLDAASGKQCRCDTGVKRDQNYRRVRQFLVNSESFSGNNGQWLPCGCAHHSDQPAAVTRQDADMLIGEQTGQCGPAGDRIIEVSWEERQRKLGGSLFGGDQRANFIDGACGQRFDIEHLDLPSFHGRNPSSCQRSQ